jgi:Family of unknown function (DUF6069)
MSSPSPATIAKGVGLGALVAIIANVIIFFIGKSGAPTQVIQKTGEAPVDLALGNVVGASLVSTVIGGIVYLIVTKVRANSFTLWSSIAGIVAVLSIFGPLNMKIDTASKVALACMHIATGAAAIFGHAFFLRDRSKKAASVAKI